jgi:hypothetical protein
MAAEVGVEVDVHVAVAVAVDHVRHGGVLEHGGDEARTPSGDQDVDQPPQLHELDGRLPAGVLHHDEGVLGQAGLGQGLTEDGGDGDVGADGGRRAPQERGVARLEAQAEGVARDVGPVLVDDGHHAQRHPDLLDAEAVRSHPAVDHRADGIGQGGHGAQAGGHAVDAGGAETEPVDHGAGDAGGLGGGHVLGVGPQHVVGPFHQEVGRREEGDVLGLGPGGGQDPGRRPGAGAERLEGRGRHAVRVRRTPARLIVVCRRRCSGRSSASSTS